MALQIDISDRKEQRKFGLLMAGAFCVLGTVRSLLHGGFSPAWFVVGGVFLVLGLVAPKVLQPVFWAWMKLAEALNYVMTRVLLALAFFVMLTPMRFLRQWFGDDPLKRKWEPDAESYWEEADEQPEKLDAYLKQF